MTRRKVQPHARRTAKAQAPRPVFPFAVTAVQPFPDHYPEDGCLLTLDNGEQVKVPWGEYPALDVQHLTLTLYHLAAPRVLTIPPHLTRVLLDTLGISEQDGAFPLTG